MSEAFSTCPGKTPPCHEFCVCTTIYRDKLVGLERLLPRVEKAIART